MEEMEKSGNTLDEVHPSKRNLEFFVYVIRLWEAPGKNNAKEVQSIEMVVEDWLANSRFHPQGLHNKMEASFEGVQNVQDNQSYVEPVETPPFQCNPFRFKSFSELMDENIVLQNDTFDFIAEVVGKEDPRGVVTNTGWETKRLVVVLQDTDNNRINCILFDSMVDHILPFLHKEHNEPLIAILQYFKISRWKGKSNFELSKVHFNLLSKEVNEFRERLAIAGPALSGRISQVHNEGALAAVDEILKGRVIVQTIEEISMFTKVGEPWIAVKFKALNVGSSDWCYSACVGCKKKVYTRDGASSNGKHGEKDTGDRVDMYKIEVMATDDTGSINLLLWDRETRILCGKPASEVKKEKVEGEDDYPKTLNNILDRQFLIRLLVRDSNINDGDLVYPVIKVIDDKEVIGKCTSIKAPMEVQGNADVDDLADSVSTINAKTPGSTASTSLSSESPLMTQPDDDSIVIPNSSKRTRVKKQKFMFE
ncbi:hypothetical protein PIB30_003224 [Stylosanthes scabra]|uniref:Replication factor A C-terminal domain-containing protein n=1 Tax=Stylosanthes scabra TaxID=79078 RepID=A0ABU6Q426_9FABA|nr:hypothetical protein [Stylosanthes scabra]